MAACDPILKSIPMYSRGAEIGVSRGESSIRFIRDRWCQMLLVDPWCKYEGYAEDLGAGDAFDVCTERLHPYRDYWTALRIKSVDAATMIPAVGTFDFVFIDGNHAYDYVMADCRAWWPHVRDGGLLCGHDWNLREFDAGVQRAVQEFAQGMKIEVYGAESELQCWSIRKPRAEEL